MNISRSLGEDMVGQNGVLLIVDLDAAQRTTVQLRFNGVLAPGPELMDERKRRRGGDMQQCGAVTGPRAWCEGPDEYGQVNAGRNAGRV